MVKEISPGASSRSAAAGHGLIDTFVPDPARPVLKMAIDLLKAVLALAVPAGFYECAKLIQNRQLFAKIVQ